MIPAPFVVRGILRHMFAALFVAAHFRDAVISITAAPRDRGY
jgi:hypothetical protein